MHIHDLALLGQGPTRGDSWRLRLSAGAPLQTSAESRGANARDHHDYAQRPARYGRSTGRTSARRGRRRRGSLRSGLETTGRVAARKCECRAPAPTAVGAAELDRDGEKEPQRRHVKVGALPFTTTGRSRLSCGAWSAQRVGFELLTHASCGRHVRCPAGDNRGGFWGFTERYEARTCGRHLASFRIDLGEVAASAGKSRSVLVRSASVNAPGASPAASRRSAAMATANSRVNG